MNLEYAHDRLITEHDFISLLVRSTLAARRPVDDPQRVKAMLSHANLICTAWDGSLLVGVARSVTDFEYCCYVSDLAVDAAYQRKGVGRELLRLTRSRLGKRATLVLLAAPDAENYYPRLGFEPHRSAWVLTGDKNLK